MKTTWVDRLFQGWKVVYHWHGSVVMEAPWGHRERYSTSPNRIVA
jgi:hypothetical protein